MDDHRHSVFEQAMLAAYSAGYARRDFVGHTSTGPDMEADIRENYRRWRAYDQGQHYFGGAEAPRRIVTEDKALRDWLSAEAQWKGMVTRWLEAETHYRTENAIVRVGGTPPLVCLSHAYLTPCPMHWQGCLRTDEPGAYVALVGYMSDDDDGIDEWQAYVKDFKARRAANGPVYVCAHHVSDWPCPHADTDPRICHPIARS